MSKFYTINYSMIKPDRFDAEYFKPDYLSNVEKLKSTGEVKTLGNLFKYIYRGTQPEYNEKGSIRVLRSVNVGNMTFNNIRQEYVTKTFFHSKQRGKVQKDDILITSTGVGTLGRSSIWNFSEEAFCDGHITILRDANVDPYLITVFLNSKYGLLQFDQNYRGSSGQIEIYPFDLSKFVVPSILFDYQKEIGEMVRQAFKLEQNAKELYNKSHDILTKELGIDNTDLDNLPNKYVSSFSEIALSHRFDSEFFNPKAKKVVSRIKQLDHVTIGANFEIKNGFPWKSDKFLEDNSGSPVIRIRDIKPTFIDNEKLTSLDIKYAESIDFLKAQPKDIVIGMDGGKYFYGSIVEEECLVNQRVCHITPKENSSISSEYATFIINSEIGQSQLLRDMTIAGTVGHITNRNVSSLIIPIFSEKIHFDITELVRNAINAEKKSKKLLRSAIKRVESIIENSISN